jgi:hypothetical protein
MITTQIGKQSAWIMQGNGYRVLQSYRTIVALQAPSGKYYKTDQKWSVTTSKHINKFCGANPTLVSQSVLDDWQTADFS